MDHKWLIVDHANFQNHSFKDISLEYEEGTIKVYLAMLLYFMKNKNSDVLHFNELIIIPLDDDHLGSLFGLPSTGLSQEIEQLARKDYVKIVSSDELFSMMIHKESSDIKENDVLSSDEIKIIEEIAEMQDETDQSEDDDLPKEDIAHEETSISNEVSITNETSDETLEQAEINKIEANDTIEGIEETIFPSIDEVLEYIKEIGSDIDAVRFYNFYNAKDWQDDNGNILDYKELIDLWVKDESYKKPEFFPKDGLKKGDVDTDEFKRFKDIFSKK